MTALEEAIKWFQQRTARKNGGRKALAEFVGTSQSNLTYWELRGFIPEKFINKLAKKTGIDADRFRRKPEVER